ncbi:MAG: phosphoribosyltransferase [Acidimicrobiia bacterium]
MEERDRAHAAVVRRFRWVDGHADVWRLFDDAPTLAAVVSALAEPWADAGITKVCGIEARGFVLAGGVALRLGAGFAAIRKAPALFPGEKLTLDAAPDYRGRTWRLQIQRAGLGRDDRVILVDDWAERGSQAVTARRLIEGCGAVFVGTSLVVDQLRDDVRARLGQVSSIVRHEDLV